MKKYTIHFSDGSTKTVADTSIVRALIEASIGTGKFMSDVIAITICEIQR